MLGLAGPCWALLGLTGPYWALLGLTGPYWALLGLTGSYLVIAERLAEEVRDEGNQLYGQQRYAEAAAKYSEAIALFPRSAAFYGNRGACQLMLGDTRGCVADCGRALALDPGYSKVRLRRARCYLDTRLAREAARDLELVLRTDPSNAEARQLLHRARLQDKTQNRRRWSNRRSVPSKK